MNLYIVSGDYIDFETPIKILKWEKVVILERKCLLIDIEKGLDYSEFGIPKPISRFILLDRFFKNRLHELNEFPIEVHVFIPKDDNNSLKGINSWEGLFNAAWASLYDSYEAALANK